MTRDRNGRQSETILIHTTAPDERMAHTICTAAVERRLAAAGHVVSIDSHYRWQGKVVTGREYRIMLKSRRASYAAVATLIRSLHNYEEPAIFFTDIAGGSESYLDWMVENATPPED